MASLTRKPRSPYFMACFTMPDGRRVQRSTKQSNRKKAQEQADEWEKLTKSKMQAKHIIKVISNIHEAAKGEGVQIISTETFFNNWLAKRENAVKPATFTAYKARAGDFISFLGVTAKKPLWTLAESDVENYRDSLADRLSAATVNLGIKIIRQILEEAHRKGHLPENVAKNVESVKNQGEESEKRRPFTMDEIKAVLAVANKEWQSMVLFAFYTAQRLADIAKLTWNNIDLKAMEVRMVTGKTGQHIVAPMHPSLHKHITETLKTPSKPNGEPVHPEAAAQIKASRIPSGLSRQFGEILAKAGLRPKVKHRKTKDGRGGRRENSALSFHSLRHSATSEMKNRGATGAVVQDIVGHESAEMSNHYTKIDSAAKRDALNLLPDLMEN